MLTAFNVVLLVVAVSNATASTQPFAPGTDWQWVPIEGSRCIDGKQTGVYVRSGTKAVTRLGIYLDGGGACFNAITCGTCSTGSHPGTPGSGGIFAAEDARNPLRDYAWVHVPYCTGDVHAGNTTKRVASGDRHFHGLANIKLMLQHAYASFPNVTDLVLTGESAGGFGAFVNFPTVRNRWPSARAVLIDDSGPVIDDADLAVCLQAKFRSTWNLNAALPPKCPCVGTAGNMSSGWAWFKSQCAPPVQPTLLPASISTATKAVGLMSHLPTPHKRCVSVLAVAGTLVTLSASSHPSTMRPSRCSSPSATSSASHPSPPATTRLATASAGSPHRCADPTASHAATLSTPPNPPPTPSRPPPPPHLLRRASLST